MKSSNLELERIHRTLEFIDQCSEDPASLDDAVAEAKCLLDYLTRIAPTNLCLKYQIDYYKAFILDAGHLDQTEQFFKDALSECFK